MYTIESRIFTGSYTSRILRHGYDRSVLQAIFRKLKRKSHSDAVEEESILDV
jgi:uncharacterized protein (UPF0335 family)